MDILNLSSNPTPTPPSSRSFSLPLVGIIIVLSLFSGFALSRILPPGNSQSNRSDSDKIISPSTLKKTNDVKVGTIYGNQSKVFKDAATGVIEKGDINGIGTHILNRSGGVSQQAALTSSILDLDLFIGHQVEVKGETNATNKAGWFLDVGQIKVLD